MKCSTRTSTGSTSAIPNSNAICTLDLDHALEQARAADDLLRRNPDAAAAKPLLGLPTAIKDLVSTKGIRTTFGSPIFADNVPDVDALIVERIRDAGAIVIGKTNIPEFGAGSQTFHPVFGKTRNPWDSTRTCGGSSGGAATALASGMLPIADGSDLGGSLRNPASFCCVVGFRPTPGRVPRVPPEQGWDDLAVLGPMGRTVADTALLFSVIAGPTPETDLSCSARHTLPPGRTSRSPRPPPRLDSQPRPLPGRARGSRGLHGRPSRPSPRSGQTSSRPRPTSPAPTASSAPCAPTSSPTSSGPCSPNTAAR